jgi:RecB family exonuclease
MLNEDKIREIAREVASANLASVNVTSVSSSPTIDSEGHDALRITIVLKSGSESRISGNAALGTLVGIRDRLRRAGEERLAIIEYATKEELEAGGDF